MGVLNTCKTEEDPFKNEGARVVIKRSPIVCVCRFPMMLKGTVDSKISRDFYFVIFRFSNYSRSFKFASKHSCGWSFPWVETRHANCSFHKVVVHRIAIHFDVPTLTAILMSLSL